MRTFQYAYSMWPYGDSPVAHYCMVELYCGASVASWLIVIKQMKRLGTKAREACPTVIYARIASHHVKHLGQTRPLT